MKLEQFRFLKMKLSFVRDLEKLENQTMSLFERKIVNLTGLTGLTEIWYDEVRLRPWPNKVK